MSLLVRRFIVVSSPGVHSNLAAMPANVSEALTTYSMAPGGGWVGVLLSCFLPASDDAAVVVGGAD